MTPETFSDLAARAGHGVQMRLIFETAQFRFAGRTFATLGWPSEGWAVLKLDPRDQNWALGLCDGLSREPGSRRRAGIILLRLKLVEPAIGEVLLKPAWRYAAQRKAVGKPPTAAMSPCFVGQAAA